MRDDAEASDAQAGLAIAQTYKHRVEITNLDDASSTTFINPDGTFTTESHAGPVRVRRDNAWTPVDTTLSERDGKVTPGAVPAELTLSAGGDGPLVQATGASGTIGYDWGSKLPKPTLKGNTAVYPQVKKGVDLVVHVTRTGFEVSARLTERPTSAVELRLPFIAKNLRLEKRADGGLTIKDKLGKDVGASDAPVMFDASYDPHTGGPLRHSPVVSELDTSGSAPVLVLRPSPLFLNDPTVLYPVTVDPSTNLTDSADTWVENDYSSSQYSSTELRIGTYNAGVAVARSYLKFNTSAVTDKHVLSANLKLYEFHSYSCTASAVNIYRLTSSFSSSTTWANKPPSGTLYTTDSYAHGYSTSCPDAWETTLVTGLVQGWANGNYANYGIALTASETSSYGWKKFNSADAGSADPYISTTYNSYPNTPGTPSLTPRVGTATPYWTSTKTPTLSATVSDPDGGTLSGEFRIYENGSSLVWSGTDSTPMANGGTSSVTVPAGKLVDGRLYTVRVYGDDGTDLSLAWSNYIQFYVDSTLPSATTVTSSDFPANVWTDDRNSGSFTFGATDTNFDHYVYDLDVATPGTALPAGTAAVTPPPIADGWHHLYVRGVDKVGNKGPIADYAFGVGGVPAAPGTVDGARGDQSVALSWAAAAPNGSAVTAYVIKTYAAGSEIASRTVGAVTSADMTGLSNGTTYTFSVAGQNSAGTGPSRTSAPVSPAGPPSAPTGVRAAPRDGQVFVRWTPADPNGDPVTGYTVKAYAGTVVAGTVTVGSVSTASVTGLTNGTAYTVKVQATNARGTGAQSAATAPQTPGGYGWSVSDGKSFGGDPNAGFVDGVNPGLGSFTTTATDASVSTLGPALGVSRTYNSADLSDTGFGVGWASNLSMGWIQNGASQIAVLYPDGRREIHTLNAGGTYDPPSGYASRLAAAGGGFTLTQPDGSKVVMGSNHKVLSMADAAGHQATLSYDANAQLATFTAFSGRRLTFTWSGGHVSTVTTDRLSATEPGLTWTYSYTTADGTTRLASVCDPRGTGSDHCTNYVYGGNLLTKIVRARGNTTDVVGYNPDGSVHDRDDGRGSSTLYDLSDPLHPIITDPSGNTTTQTVDGSLRLTAETDATGDTQTFGYDPNGFRNTTTDANGDTTSVTFDANGNALSTTDAGGKTAHATYDANNNITSSCDERSSSLTDTTYCTTYTYDANRNKLSETTPDGAVRRWTYTTGTEAAVGGGLVPAALQLTESDFRGNLTTYKYTAAGDVAEIIKPLGQRTAFTYDGIGRRIKETVYSDTFPAGVTNEWTYDGLGAVLTQTGPAVTNTLSGAQHQLQVTNTYDKNGNVVAATQADLLGGDPARTTTYAYDSYDRQISKTDSLTGKSMTTSYDERGNVSVVTDQLGRRTRTDYDSLNRAVTVTQLGVVDDPIANSTPRDIVLQRTTYDPTGRVLTQVDAIGQTKAYTYDSSGRVATVKLVNFREADGSTRVITLQKHVYNAVGQLLDDYSGGDLRRVTNTYDRSGRLATATLDPGGLDRKTTYVYDEDGNALTTTLSDGQRTETTSRTYDAEGHVLTTTVDAGNTTLVSKATFDRRGVQTSTINPRGTVSGADPQAFTTTTTTDELGRVVAVSLPPVLVESDGASASTQRPTTYMGYDTFGDLTHAKDPNGNVTVSTFDQMGRRVGVTYPSYTTPAGTTIVATESWTYDALGNPLEHVDRRGGTHTFVYDSRNRVVAEYDPLLSGQSARGITRSTYDDLGQRLTKVDQLGATTTWTYDALGRARTSVALVRQSGGATQQRETGFAYDDLGSVTSTTDPSGARSSATFNAAGERLTSKDPAGHVTATSYDVGGRPVSTIDPLGRRTTSTYDLAGRLTAQSRYDATGALLATESWTYDAAGNQVSARSARGFVTTLTYDAANRLTAVVTPGDHGEGITNSAGYDANGNVTRQTDGRGNTTIRTFTTANLPEKAIEPSTQAHPGLTDRTWTLTYDAAGQPVREDEPGGVSITRNYDALGRLTSESGTGTGVANATRTFGYDLRGQRTSLTAPAGQNTYTYDDSGALLTAAGPSGAASFTYDAAGRVLQRMDGAGSVTFGYDARGLLASATDSLTDVTRTYAYDAAAQLTSVALAGSGGVSSHRDYTYDAMGRLLTDRLLTSAGAATASYTYAYDADGNIVQKTISLPSNASNGTHSFAYDQQGRLTSWTAPGGATTDYSWDGAGNRTRSGTATYTYDQRNRQLTGPEGTSTWSPNGNLTKTVASGGQTTQFSYDGFSRLISSTTPTGQVTTSAYDSLDRLVSGNQTTWTYAGASIKPVSGGAELFARTLSDDVVAITNGTSARIAGTDLHHDLTYLAGADGSVAGSRVYDPFGTLTTSSGTITSALGFQSDVTDSATGNVWMGARWYGPARDTFLSEDDLAGSLAKPDSLNRYGYAAGDPVGGYDADGHSTDPVNVSGVAFSRNLRLASPYMRGDDVYWVQQRLNWHGAGIATDGIFGPKTSSAVIRYQRGHNLADDGIVGPKTWHSLATAQVVGASSPNEDRPRIDHYAFKVNRVSGAGKLKIDMFIPTATINGSHGSGVGDGRNFDPYAPDRNSRAQVVLNFETGQGSLAIQASCLRKDAGIPLPSYGGAPPVLLRLYNMGCYGPTTVDINNDSLVDLSTQYGPHGHSQLWYSEFKGDDRPYRLGLLLRPGVTGGNYLLGYIKAMLYIKARSDGRVSIDGPSSNGFRQGGVTGYPSWGFYHFSPTGRLVGRHELSASHYPWPLHSGLGDLRPVHATI